MTSEVQAPDRMSTTDCFATHRNLLFTVAYETLGSATDAEDVLREARLRWAPTSLESARDARAYLVRITARLALERLRALARRRESYAGSWLPEPLLTAPGVADDPALADSVSTATLLVLETLAPTERAVFVLREVFDLGYEEIAEAVAEPPAAVRRIAQGAAAHVQERVARGTVSRRERDEVMACFERVAATGDLEGLGDVLSPDAVLVADGGARSAPLRPTLGSDKVLRLLAGVTDGGFDLMQVCQVNGAPAIALSVDGRPDTVVTTLIEDGLVAGLYLVRNPEKLRRLSEEVPLTR